MYSISRWVFLRVVPHFDEPVRRVKMQTTSKRLAIIHNKTDKRFIIQHGKLLCPCEYFRGMRDRSMRSGTELAREIQLTDWSTAGEQGKLVFMISTKPSLAQITSLFTTGKYRPNYTSIQVFLFKTSVRNKRRKEIRMTNKIFFRKFNSICRVRVTRKPV